MNNGMLILDGMGTLAPGAEMSAYTCIRPGVMLGSMDGLSRTDFTSAVAAIFVDAGHKAANDDNVEGAQ